MPSLKAPILFSSTQQAILFVSGLFFGLLLNLPLQAQSQNNTPVRPQTQPVFDQKIEILALNEDGDFISKSGQILRPAELNLPRRGDCERLSQVCPVVEKIHDYYTQNLVGRTVLIDKSTAFRDRYNRLHAHLQVPGGAWIQYLFLQQGLARVETFTTSPLTTPYLLGIEAVARDQRKGLWSLKAYEPLSTDILKNKMDRFQIIEGTIHKTAEVKGVIYLNFGDNWREDFTIKLTKDMRRNFKDKGQSLLDLKDRSIRIRGWLFWENGPMISLYHPEQLEILPPN